MSQTQKVHKFLTDELTVRAAGVVATHVVEEMRSIQHTYPIATVALGRAMVGALLMASHLKQKQELSLYWQGNGPLASLFAEATHEGNVRAYTPQPHLNMPMDDKILVGPAIGIGLLTVTHHQPAQVEPHRGTVIIRSGEIGDDIAFYLEQSHQIPSIVAVGVHVDTYGRVEAAGGVLIELMPGVSEETIEKLEKRLSQVPSVSKRILEGATGEDLVRDYLADFTLLPMEHDYPIKYHCRCTIERVERSVALLGLSEIDSIIAEGKPLEVICEFCGRKYILEGPQMKDLRQRVYRSTLN